jgi:hypothetical protein
MVLGIGLAAAGLAVTGILLRAEQRGLDGDTPALRTLGFTGRDLGAVAALRNVPVAIASTVLAVLVAIGLSGRYPVGIGRKIELDGGIRVDPLVLGVGALVLVVVLLVAAYLLGLPRSDRRALPSHRRTLARTLAAGGAPTDLTLATQLLFERGRGVRPVPSRVAIAAGAVAVAIMCAVGTYVAGIDHLYSDPGAHGWNWDVAMGNTNFRLSHATRVATRKDDRFTHETIAGYGNAAVDGKGVELLAIAAGGDAPPAIVRGRLPRTASEIALGRAFLDKIGAHIGSIVGLSVVGGEFDGRGKRRTQRMRVVGEALPPIFGEADIGDAGIVTDGGIRAAGGVVTPHYVLADLRAGRSGAAALRRDYTQELVTDTIPARIVNLHGVRGLPELGVGIAGLLGTIVLVSTLGISARARAREVAVLRSLGLPARRLRSVLGWQGLVLGAGMLLVGIPVGLGIGIAFWRRIADGLGVGPDVTIPPLVVVLVPVLLLVAGGASILLARRARRAPVSDLLRVE